MIDRLVYTHSTILKPPRQIVINRGNSLSRGLVGCWFFSEGAGSSIYDISGYGQIGNFGGTGVINWVGSPMGFCTYFDGTDDKVISVNTSTEVRGDDPLSFSIWFIYKSTSNFQRVCAFQKNSGGFLIATNDLNAGDISFAVSNGLGDFGANGNSNKAVKRPSTVFGTLIHLVGSMTSGGSKTIGACYINGEKATATDTGTWTAPANDGVLYLGAGSSTGASSPPCVLIQCSLWNRMITEPEMRFLYREPMALVLGNQLQRRVWWDTSVPAVTNLSINVSDSITSTENIGTPFYDLSTGTVVDTITTAEFRDLALSIATSVFDSLTVSESVSIIFVTDISLSVFDSSTVAESASASLAVGVAAAKMFIASGIRIHHRIYGSTAN